MVIPKGGKQCVVDPPDPAGIQWARPHRTLKHRFNTTNHQARYGLQLRLGNTCVVLDETQHAFDRDPTHAFAGQRPGNLGHLSANTFQVFLAIVPALPQRVLADGHLPAPALAVDNSDASGPYHQMVDVASVGAPQ